jgi:hypothetical protein
MQLSDYVGQTLTVLIPRIHEDSEEKVRVHGVEAGGVWIESQRLTNRLMTRLSASTAPKTLVFFFPYHEIVYAMVPIDVPALNETGLHVQDQD